MKRLVQTFFVVLALLMGCRGRDLPRESFMSVLSAVEPTLALDQLRLPATVERVAHERPSARLTQFGLTEFANERELMFNASDGATSATVTLGDTVRGIAISRKLLAYDSAETEWTRMMARFDSATSALPACSETDGPLVRSRLARWRVADGIVFLQVFLDPPPSAIATEPRVVVGGSSDGATAEALRSMGREVPCRRASSASPVVIARPRNPRSPAVRWTSPRSGHAGPLRMTA